MISKELLSEVLEEEVLEIYGFTNSKTRLEYKLLSRVDGESINIHELAHKCKEYLLDKGYCIIIHAFKVELFEKDTNSFIRDFHYPIQAKAIPYDIKRVIKSCQWILDNTEG